MTKSEAFNLCAVDVTSYDKRVKCVAVVANWFGTSHTGQTALFAHSHSMFSMYVPGFQHSMHALFLDKQA